MWCRQINVTIWQFTHYSSGNFTGLVILNFINNIVVKTLTIFVTVFDSLSCKTKYYWAFKERLICILWIISRLVSHPSQPRLIKGSHRARLCWCRVSTGGEDLLSLRRLGFFNFDMIDCYQLNIPYGQLSAKLPVIQSLGSFGSLGSFRSFGSFSHLDRLGHSGHSGHSDHFGHSGHLGPLGPFGHLGSDNTVLHIVWFTSYMK